MDLELGEHYNVTFTDPDVVKHAESLAANGYRISSAGELLPTPRTVGEEGVSTIAWPVDLSEGGRFGADDVGPR
ncbi:MAG: acetolactate synthase large subunit [Mycobacterium sp.]|jgi:acetolactate synthase-1/2/3 large subunit|nr:acetolactate synthase large subunit [Mycobacterium sp.]